YGFTNFKIVPSPVQPNAYQIQRIDGTLATNTLSEGEETFISFLYFLQFAKGSVDVEKVSNRKVLVLDDPICSLDSTVLYIVSSLVKGLIKDIREGSSDVEQIFIFTHNVFFHKETAFIDSRTDTCNDIYYWTISKDNNISSIKAYERENPIKTSYELMWHELKSNTNASLVTTQNIMRRILENYFRILGKKRDATIIDAFTTIEEKMICRSLLSWINDGSHTIPDDLYIDSYTDSIDRYKQIFEKVFVEMGHGAHYNMMMQKE
ncbi:MAG: AAA family ATPase, partial [Candidatus Excrementavichristensenella sp.]